MNDWEDAILEKTLKSYYQEFDYAKIQKINFDNFIYHRIHKIIEEESLLEIQINDDEYFRMSFDNIL